MQQWAVSWLRQVWAIEGAPGLGRLPAQELLGGGQLAVQVQPELAARVRPLTTAR